MNVTQSALEAAQALFDITPLQPSLGAQISGIDLREQRHMERVTIAGDVPYGPATNQA